MKLPSSGIDPRTFAVLFAEGAIGPRSDVDLIHLFTTREPETAEAAFAALIDRHGPMVLGVCRRILGDEHAAEDAFQAVFLVLARRASAVRVDDSLGRWLYGVAKKVAVKARQRAAREIPGAASPRRIAIDPIAEVARDEVRRLVDREVALLPRKYREPAALCHLDGLTHDQAAEALGVPVGTIRSRLSRARDLLRPRLIRRGLAPAVAAGCLASPTAGAAVPRLLAEAALAGVVPGAAVPAAVLALTKVASRPMAWLKTAAVASVAGLAVGGAVLSGGDPPAAPMTPPIFSTEAPPSLEDEVRAIIREYEDARKRNWARADSLGKTEFERSKLVIDGLPDLTACTRRLNDVIARDPKAPGARDGLVWVITQRYAQDGGSYGLEFARAVDQLVRYHADDPEVARAGIGMESSLSRNRDAFLEGIYATAESRESKGLIRLAYGRYLLRKAWTAEIVRRNPGRSFVSWEEFDALGNRVQRRQALSNEEEGYRTQLRMFDPESLRREGERILEAVVADYADVPYVTTHKRSLQRQLRERPPATIADPAERKEWEELERDLAADRRTIGEEAAGTLDEVRNLAVGTVAPDFEGLGVDGRPIKLSNHRGEVVVVSFWNSRCKPSVEAIAEEKALVQAMKGRPFAFLGVVIDGDQAGARKVIEEQAVPWPNILDGSAIAKRYHAERCGPTYYVLAPDGVILWKDRMASGKLGTFLERLMVKAEQPLD